VTAEFDDILDGLFHGCALAAFLEQAEAEQGWPESEATKQRAYRYYEDALAAKNRSRAAESDQPEEADAAG
jgi:hypothetical protein